MKKLILILFIIIMLTGCSITPQNHPTLWKIAHGDTPYDLYKIHEDIMNRLTPVPGTDFFEYRVLDNGKIAGHVKPDGFPGWCSNYAAAARAQLFEAGYTEDQVKYIQCSIFDTKKPDHVVVMVTTSDNKKWILDANKKWVMTPEDYPKKLTYEGMVKGDIAYIWWAKAENEWIKVDF